MGAAACVIIINGNQAYASVENLADRYHNVSINNLEAAITASCSLTSYVSLFLQIRNDYLEVNYSQPIIDLHRRIITELANVERQNAQNLVDELASLLFTACDNMVNATET